MPLGSIIARTERDLIVDRFVWGRSCGRGRLSSSVVCVRALGGSALWAWASWPFVTCVRALAGMPLVPRPGKRGLARLTTVPGAGDDGSLSGAAILPRTVGGNLSRLLVGNEQVVLYHVLRLAPAQGEGL